MSAPSSQFADLVLGSQRRLYAYILTLLPDPDTAWDIQQQTNMVLWRNSERFSTGTKFMSWAFRVAYFQVLDYREKQQRDRLQFNSELFDQLASESQQACGDDEARLESLQKCLSGLPSAQRHLLHSRGIGYVTASDSPRPARLHSTPFVGGVEAMNENSPS